MKEINREELLSLIRTDEDYERLYWFSSDNCSFWLEGFVELGGDEQIPRIVECSYWLNDKEITTVSGVVESLCLENGKTYLIEYEGYESACAGIVRDFLPREEEINVDAKIVVCRDDELPEIIKQYSDGSYNIWVYVED